MRTGTGPIALLFSILAPAVAQNYTITTVAGGGRGIGAGAVATDISLPNPWGVAVDPQGNVYSVVPSANQVYVFSASGVVINIIGNGTSGFGGD